MRAYVESADEEGSVVKVVVEGIAREVLDENDVFVLPRLFLRGEGGGGVLGFNLGKYLLRVVGLRDS